ncbi:MAG TPA: peptidase E [Ktedonobacteraceae bacterium]|nr:peptidase E [Ktedonobacteraceae bacterium]
METTVATRKIFAIGGAGYDLENLAIEKEIIRFAQKEHPRVLSIPTASYDDKQWSEVFQQVYRQRLGCATDVLWLLREQPTQQQIAEKILSADIIWVGGGNTLKMMKRWRKLGVDKLLKQAHDKGTVLSGTSAGSICWFQYGHSDSMSFYGSKQWNYVLVRGLGFINAIHCPHYHAEHREQDFARMLSRRHHGPTLPGIALDNAAALQIHGDRYRLRTFSPEARGYKAYKKDGKIMEEEIEPKEEYAPLEELLRM